MAKTAKKITAVNEANKETSIPKLAARDWTILALVVILAKTNKEIANDLGLDEGTVKVYITNVCTKLRLKRRNRGSLATWWEKRALLEEVGQ